MYAIVQVALPMLLDAQTVLWAAVFVVFGEIGHMVLSDLLLMLP